MRLFSSLLLLLVSIELIYAVSRNTTKPSGKRKTLRMVKKLKSSKSSSKATEQAKSESYRVPIIISAPPNISPHDIPVSIELHDDDRYFRSSPDFHPIEPIHLKPVLKEDGHPRRVHQAHYSSDGNDPQPRVYHGPVAVPSDYPYGSAEPKNYYEPKNELSLGDYYSDTYGDLSAIPGAPGIDYPTFSHLPETGFKCLHHTSTPGFYADVETKCQMWHYCQPDGRHDRFLCPNGTIFDQMTRVCNWWYNVWCDDSISNYDINFDLYREPLRIIQPQVIETPVYHHDAKPSHPENAIVSPNSFLRHVEDFEAGRAKLKPGDSYRDYSQQDSYHGPIQAAASPQEQRYPIKLAPPPKVRHDIEGIIDYESSNPHTSSTPVEKLKSLSRKKVQKKRIGKRKMKKQPKVYSKHNDDNIPTYREAKATPAARRYRVVRRRKINKN